MRTQRISSHVAPVIIDRLRTKIKDLKKENKDLKKSKAKAGFRIHNIHKILTRSTFTSRVFDVEWKKYTAERDSIFSDSNLSRDEQDSKADWAHEEYQRRKDIKLEQVKALFDLRKKQDLKVLELEAEKIINS
jgi:hypothetical protein